MTYTTSITKTKAAQYDLPGIEDMVPNIWSPVKVAYDKHALWGISHWRDQLTRVERVEDLQLRVESYQKKINVTKPETIRPDLRNKDPYTPYADPQGFIYVDNKGRNRVDDTMDKEKEQIQIKEAINKQLKERMLMRSLEKFVGGRHYGTDL
ncbi:hypothetical protein Tco_0024678 [Tanacetum coccineum]